MSGKKSTRGGYRENAGRTAYVKEEDKLNACVTLFFTKKEKEELQKKAKNKGVSMSQFMREAILEKYFDKQ